MFCTKLQEIFDLRECTFFPGRSENGGNTEEGQRGRILPDFASKCRNADLRWKRQIGIRYDFCNISYNGCSFAQADMKGKIWMRLGTPVTPIQLPYSSIIVETGSSN